MAVCEEDKISYNPIIAFFKYIFLEPEIFLIFEGEILFKVKLEWTFGSRQDIMKNKVA